MDIDAYDKQLNLQKKIIYMFYAAPALIERKYVLIPNEKLSSLFVFRRFVKTTDFE